MTGYRGKPRSLVGYFKTKQEAQARRDDLKDQGLTAWVEVSLAAGFAVYKLDEANK